MERDLRVPRVLAMTQETCETMPRWVRFWNWAGPLFGIAWVLAPTISFFAGEDPSAWQIVLVVPLIVVFSALFLDVVMTQRPVPAPVLGMLAISVGLTLGVSDTFAFLFIWPASAASARLSGLTSGKALTAITALAAGTIALTDPDGALFWGVTSLVFGTGALWLLIGGLMRANAELREARAELAEKAVADERLRFARDLHDILGHDLSLIALKAELAGKLLPDRVDAAALSLIHI